MYLVVHRDRRIWPKEIMNHLNSSYSYISDMNMLVVPNFRSNFMHYNFTDESRILYRMYDAGEEIYSCFDLTQSAQCLS